MRHDVSYGVFTALAVDILPRALNGSWDFLSVIIHQ